MVYSAMKIFMEINPTLFDECTSDYAQAQESAPQRLAERENIWKALEEAASKKRKEIEAAGSGGDSNANQIARPLSGSPMQITDDAASDSQKKMDALHIQDEGANKAVGYA
jgi:serine/threonine-protein phosphatase 2A regulatory subunit B'